MTSAAIENIELLTEQQLSTLINVKVDTLRFWRQTRTGPPYIKMGSAKQSPVRYQPSDVLAYFEKHRVTSEYDPAA